MPRKQVRKKTCRLLGNCTDLVQCSNFKALFFDLSQTQNS